MIDPSKDNFTQSLSFKEILEELEISKDNYYRALSIQKRKILKRETNSCKIKSLAGRYGHIQSFFNLYKGVTDMCRYFSKTEDQCLQVMKNNQESV